MATEATRYRALFESKGLRVTETKSNILALDGRRVEYHSISGVKEGVYKVTVRLEPKPQSVSLIISAENENKAQDVAARLEELGFTVDVDGERVHASRRGASLALAARAVEVAEKASKKKA